MSTHVCRKSSIPNHAFHRLAAGAATLLLAAGAAQATIGISASSVSFIDISATGTTIASIADDSETTVTGALLNAAGWTGNGLLAGGVSMRVGNNGGIVWGNSATDTFVTGSTLATNVGYYNSGPLNWEGAASIATMPGGNGGESGNGNGIRQFLAVLWDDYKPSTTAGTTTSIKWKVVSGDLIVQWTNETHVNAVVQPGFSTFEMIAHGGVSIASGLSLVDFVYQDTLFQANQYQDDGGSAAIGYKNWGLKAGANDVEYGIGGGGNDDGADPVFGDPSMQPKVTGWIENNGSGGPHSVTIALVPTPTSAALLGLGGLAAALRRRR